MDDNIKVNDVILSPQAIDTLLSLQRCDNEYFDMYDEHLVKINNILFRIGGEMNVEDSKNEIFELLNNNHSLREDLRKLKTPK